MYKCREDFNRARKIQESTVILISSELNSVN